MASNYDINELKRRMQGAIGVLKTELGGLRTGRASAHLLDPVQVDAYGQSMPLNQVATVSVPQPRVKERLRQRLPRSKRGLRSPRKKCA